jgi:hypothetical protein
MTDGTITWAEIAGRLSVVRNLAADPRVIVHLESGEDVLIVRGVVEDLGAPAMVPSVVATPVASGLMVKGPGREQMGARHGQRRAARRAAAAQGRLPG